ncbi:MAG: hypothetical protein ACP5LG_08460, partial [Conexivisphaera sp.]
MRPPNPKEIPEYMPEFLRMGVQMALSIMYDGKVYDDHIDRCPYCGSGNIKRAGYKGKVFAYLIAPGRPEGEEDDGRGSVERKGNLIPVRVYRQRYICNSCGGIYVSRGPFYGSTKYGAPIVDLALALSMEHSSYQVEEMM